MNKRIKEFAEQAGWDISEIMKIQNAIKMQKFAELIVKECATLADDFGVHLAGYRDTEGRDLCYAVRDTIKQHFGVK